MNDCLFCKIAGGDIPAQIAYRDEHVTAFWDINPQAPVHLLIVPNRHVESVAALQLDQGPLLAAMIGTANRLAEREGVASSGYRLVFNVGADAGMSVPHLHLHLLGGRRLQWPPG